MGRVRRLEAMRQERPFRSVGQEAVIALLPNAEAVRWPLQDLLAARVLLTLRDGRVTWRDPGLARTPVEDVR